MQTYHYTIKIGEHSLSLTFNAHTQAEGLSRVIDALLFAKITDAHCGDPERDKKNGYTNFKELKNRHVFSGRVALKQRHEEIPLISDAELLENNPDLALRADAPERVTKADQRTANLVTVGNIQESL